MDGFGDAIRSMTVRASGSRATSSQGTRASGATGAPGSEPAKSLVMMQPSGAMTKLLLRTSRGSVRLATTLRSASSRWAWLPNTT